MRLKLKKNLFLVFGLLLVFLPGCLNENSKESAQQPAPVTRKQPQITTEITALLAREEEPKGEPLIQNPYIERLHAFIEGGHLLTLASPDDAKRELGKPLKKAIKKVKNKHEKNMDEWITYVYKDMRLVFYHALNHNRFFLFNIEITGSKRPVMYGLDIGKTKEDVLAELGEFGHSTETSLEYHELGEDYLPGLVRFYFEAGRIAKITWIYPLD